MSDDQVIVSLYEDIVNETEATELKSDTPIVSDNVSGAASAAEDNDKSGQKANQN